jgi:hypothetical protein
MISPVVPSRVIRSPSASSRLPVRSLRFAKSIETPDAPETPHPARHDRRVAGHPAARREDALGGVHAVDVFRTGLDADQDHLLAAPGPALGRIRIEHDLPRSRAGARRQALGQHVAHGVRVERRVEQLVERHRIDAQHRGLLVDQPFAGHVDGHLERRLGGALAAAGLQHPQLALLHRELDVLHVAVVPLEQLEHAGQLRVSLGHRLFHRRHPGPGLLARRARQVLRGADAGDDVLALGVDQPLAVIRLLAGRGIAGEGDAGGRGLAHVAEHHRLDVDRGAPVAGDVVEPAVDLGAVALPAVEHRGDRAVELLPRIVGEVAAGFLADDRLVAVDERIEILLSQLGVEVDSAVLLGDLERLLEQAVIDAHHYVGVHLNEAAVRVPGEAFVPSLLGEADHRHRVQPEVEHGIHHAGHRHPRARPDRHQQRKVGVRLAKAGAGSQLDVLDAVPDLRL